MKARGHIVLNGDFTLFVEKKTKKKKKNRRKKFLNEFFSPKKRPESTCRRIK
jgi:hypothetical protein